MQKIKILPTLAIVSLSTVNLPLVSCSKEEDKGEVYDDTTPLCFNDVRGDKQEAQVLYIIEGAPLDIDIEYKLDDWEKGDWIDWNEGDKITLKNGHKLFVRNTKNTLSRLNSFLKFVITGDVKCSGNVNSMINYGELTTGCFMNLFSQCKTLKRAPALPATILAENCYQNMFSECESLPVAPQLPAENLVDYCYTGMFNKCIALTTAPRLNSIHLAPHCYEQMFEVCGFTQAPELPAENLAESCYAFMFCHCPITTTPALPSTHLAKNCYRQMFANCRQLVQTTEILPATTLKESCYDHMFAYCDLLKMVPSLMGQLYNLKCYEKMFKDCPSLNIEQDSQDGKLICSFPSDLQDISVIASEMFGGTTIRQGFIESNGTPTLDHSYYCINNTK